MNSSFKNIFIEWLPLLCLTFFVSSCRSFLAEPRFIPSGSMLPELQINLGYDSPSNFPKKNQLIKGKVINVGLDLKKTKIP